MPHIIVKLYSGRSATEKARLADEITKAVMKSLACGEESVSVAIEDVKPREWAEKVYKPYIISSEHTLFKKPGYSL